MCFRVEPGEEGGGGASGRCRSPGTLRREGAVRVGNPHCFLPLPPPQREGSEGWGPDPMDREEAEAAESRGPPVWL